MLALLFHNALLISSINSDGKTDENKDPGA